MRGYGGYITIGHKTEKVKILALDEATTGEITPQKKVFLSWEKTVWVEDTTHI